MSKSMVMPMIAAGVFVAIIVLFRICTEPRNYDDCVLSNMKNAQSDKAATAIVGACKKKFPEYVSEEKFTGQ